MELGVALLAIVVVLYGLSAERLGRWSVTMPMVFVFTGLILGPKVLNLLPIAPQAEPVKLAVEITLGLLLFADASTLDLAEIQRDPFLPVRLLTVGLLLTIVLGALGAFLVLPRQDFAFACLLGAMLAPTDAALGLPIFNNPLVPVRIRRALNIESGLNDGIATPFVIFFLGLAVETENTPLHGGMIVSALVPVVLAVVAGAVVGIVGGRLLSLAKRRKWTNAGAQQLAILGLAFGSYFGSLAIGGNGFIAAFVGGLVFSAATHGEFVEPTEFTETAGSFLSILVWTIFGAVLVGDVLTMHMGWQPILYAIISLTIVRVLPVGLSMWGTGLRRDTVGIMGWFGPRGLASVVFTLMALESFQEAGRSVEMLVAAATWTILLSVLAHGLSAVPISKWYARRLDAAANAGEPLAEFSDLPEMRTRRPALATHAERG